MSGSKLKLSLIVCTKDRPKEIAELFESISKQSVKPFEIIIVDGGEKTVAHIADRYQSLNVRYYALHPPSLTRQRNLGIRNLHPESTLVSFLDDDLVLQPQAIEYMLKFWDRASADVGGASFNIVNYHLTKTPFLKSFFLLDAPERGKILSSGVGSAYFPASETKKVDWLCGGATVWRRSVFQNNLYDEFYYELGWNEDIDFSYRISKTHQLMVVRDAEVIHNESQTSRIDNFRFGQIQTVHRFYFVKKYGKPFSLIACAWACLGQMLVNLLRGIFGLNQGLIERAIGNGFGFLTRIRFFGSDQRPALTQVF